MKSLAKKLGKVAEFCNQLPCVSANAPTLIAPEAVIAWPAPALSVRPPALALMPAFSAIEPEAFSARVVAALHCTELLSVILPACVPLEPVEIVTLALASAFCRVVVLIFVPALAATKPPLSAPEEIVTSHGSSNRVPVNPCAARRLVAP